jgi:dipeptidyl aminopeptidase/acylaminoacyl peptidase
MRADGSGQRDLTNHPHDDFHPVYSPDGKRITFSRGETFESAELYIMNADGSNVRRLTNNDVIDWDSAWSPDGRRLVFQRAPAPASPEDPILPADLWILDLKTGEERQLTNSPAADDGEAQWSPDGRRIAFHSEMPTGQERDGRADLYAGFCDRRPTASTVEGAGRRPSISACRRRQAPAAYPQASGGPPSIACASRHLAAPTLLGLAPGGVYRATPVTRSAGGLLPHRFTLTGAHYAPAVCSLWHFPAGRPGLPLTTTLPCGVRTFLGSQTRTPG